MSTEQLDIAVGKIPFASEVTNDELSKGQHAEASLRANVKTPQRTLSLCTLIFQNSVVNWYPIKLNFPEN